MISTSGHTVARRESLVQLSILKLLRHFTPKNALSNLNATPFRSLHADIFHNTLQLLFHTYSSGSLRNMDRQSVYSLSVLAPDYSENSEDSRRQVQTQLQNFILEFRFENAFIYRWAPILQPSEGILISL